MITHIPFHQLGKADHGWLKANHHFSFANYYNPDRMGFGNIRVINDDLIKAGQGFPAHGHNNMEIITYIRTGEVSHQDNTGNKGVTRAGEVQVMSAGSGIVHSEYNLSNSDLTLYQIWVTPNKQNVTPRWQSKPFPRDYVEKQLELVVTDFDSEQLAGESDEQTAPLRIHQDARIYAGKLKAGTEINHTITGQAYVLASEGDIELKGNEQEGVLLNQGDGAEITNISSISITAKSNAEVVVIEVS